MGATELTDFLQKTAGADLRGVVKYMGELTDIIYLRQDITEEGLGGEVEAMVDRLRSESQPAETGVFPFGELRLTVRHFEEAAILHFPTAANEGIVVAFEPAVVAEIDSFIADCQQRIDAE